MTKAEYPLHKLTNGVLREYLDFMSETESPPIFHAWSLISAASACMGRRCWFQMGAIRIMPNQYVMLVGAPGVRKSSTISFARKLLEDTKGLRFAPNNTAGRMQGLMARMIGDAPKADSVDEDMQDAMDTLNTNLLAGVPDALIDEDDINILDRHALYVMEGELASFIGIKSNDFITFLTDMWDKSGEPSYEYQLKRERMKVPFPCLNMIGAITSMHLTTYLPPEAIGQGFTSRVIMVFAEETKKVAWPEPLDPLKQNGFKAILNNIFSQREGVFEYEPAVKTEIIRLHEKGYGQIEDARFIHYLQRRQAHMIKVAMAFCALRMSQVVSLADVQDANLLLQMTEAKMADSLGEYGMSPIALARARVMDMLKIAREPLTMPRISMAVGGDVRHAELMKAVYELEEDGKIVQLTVKDLHGNQRSAYVTHKELIKRGGREAEEMKKVSYDFGDTAAVAQVKSRARQGLDVTTAKAPPKSADQNSTPSIEELGRDYVPPVDAVPEGAMPEGETIMSMIKNFTKH